MTDREELIQCLIATQGQSEGVTADAILSLFARTGGEVEAVAVQKRGRVVPFCDLPVGTKLYTHSAPAAAVHKKILIRQSMAFLADKLKHGGQWSQQCDHIYERAGEALLSLTAAPQPLGESEKATRLIAIVEGIDNLEHGTFRSEKSGIRLKDTPQWVEFYNYIKAATQPPEGE